MTSLARAAASAARSALRPAPLAGRVRSSPLPSLASPSTARAAHILRRSATAGLETLVPLHSAVAAARLRSCIAVDSSCWSSLSQDAVKSGTDDGTMSETTRRVQCLYSTHC